MDAEVNSLEKRVFLARLYDYYKPLLTDKQREIFEIHEFSDLSLAEIAEQQSVTRQSVHYVLLRTRQKLEELEAKLGFARRIDELENELMKAGRQ